MQSNNTEPIAISLQQEADNTISPKQEPDNVPEDVRLVYLLNTTSTEIVASNERRKEGTVLFKEETPWLQKVPWIQNLSFENFSDVFISKAYRDEGVPAIAFVAPIPERPERAIVAVTRAQTRLNRVTEQREDQFITVIDDDDRIIMDTRGDQYVGRRYAEESSTDNVSAILTDRSGFMRDVPNQASLEQDYVAAYSTMTNTGWTVVTYAPEDDVYLIRSNIITNLIQMILVSLVGLAVIGIAIAGGTVYSINRLAEQVKEVEDGNLDVDFSTSRKDEIGQLYDGFDSMRDSLEERITELSLAIRAEERMRKRLSNSNEELQQQQVIISVLNRLLRHNLRNSLTSILLYTQSVSDDVPPEHETEFEKIVTTSERLLRKVKKSKYLEQIVGTDPENLSSVDVGMVVKESVKYHRDEYPEATISATLSFKTYAKVGNGMDFVINNLIENAIEHNDSREPHVDIRLHTVSDEDVTWVELIVEDNGPGIPDSEIAVLDRGEETALEHGSGVGLWLVKWLVDHVEGELQFTSVEPRGTRVTVRFLHTNVSTY
ncbi:ATP-binding protein [Halovenus rubra]|uniref:ATP-binding protein n=2 Tax=Halovenus rubra TaxID=869890 RepID=A0ACC7DZN8_9EURY|nr:HAMP domain-containing sensor histidine kinase [Halovenus rubra]